ncbi:helix-turn-helix domain-containing protein [Microcoleus sp. A003_D6]|uniref:helix-turn-helix domain-containing protein n=1 Tax=Microcoleus sp. A003_D6 TaxID=3055266 RepID=UPI002FD6AB35
MFLSCQYKLRHSNQQSDKLSGWLDMLRATYNWCLPDRIDGWRQQFLMGDYCDLRATVEITPLTCSLVKGTQLANPWKTRFGKAKKKGEKKRSRKRSASLMQDANLINLKVSRPLLANLMLLPLKICKSKT